MVSKRCYGSNFELLKKGNNVTDKKMFPWLSQDEVRQWAINRLTASSEVVHPFKTILQSRHYEPVQLVSNITRADKRREHKAFWSQGNRPRVVGRVVGPRRVKRMFWRRSWEQFRDPRA